MWCVAPVGPTRRRVPALPDAWMGAASGPRRRTGRADSLGRRRRGWNKDRTLRNERQVHAAPDTLDTLLNLNRNSDRSTRADQASSTALPGLTVQRSPPLDGCPGFCQFCNRKPRVPTSAVRTPRSASRERHPLGRCPASRGVDDLESLEETLGVMARPKLLAQIRGSLAESHNGDAKIFTMGSAPCPPERLTRGARDRVDAGGAAGRITPGPGAKP